MQMTLASRGWWKPDAEHERKRTSEMRPEHLRFADRVGKRRDCPIQQVKRFLLSRKNNRSGTAGAQPLVSFLQET